MVAKRSIALLIDMILIDLCWTVYSLVMIPLFMAMRYDTMLCVLLFLALAFVFFLARDAVRGMSVGKFIVGIQVVDSKTGKPIGLWQSALRNSLLYILLVIEFFVMICNSKGLRLGDRLAETRVVDAKDQGLSHYLKRLFK